MIEAMETLNAEVTAEAELQGNLSASGNLVSPAVIKQEVEKAVGERLENAITEHNESESSHSEIRKSLAENSQRIGDLTSSVGGIAELTNKTLKDLVDLDQKVDFYNESAQQGLERKISKSDIANDLVTNESEKVLSAAQGFELKKEIDEVGDVIKNSRIIEEASDIQPTMSSGIVGATVKFKDYKEYRFVVLDDEDKIYDGFLPEPLIKSIVGAGGPTTPYVEIKANGLTYKLPNLNAEGKLQSGIVPQASQEEAGVVKYAPFIHNQENGYLGGNGVVSADMVYQFVKKQIGEIEPSGGQDLGIVGEAFTGVTGDTLIWDGDTTGREVVNTNFYKVSDATPSYEELSKGVAVYYKSLSSNGVEYLYDASRLTINKYETYCSIGTSKSTYVYVYYENNEAGVAPGVYMYCYPNSYCYSRLIITDYTGFEPTATIKDEALNPVAHTVGAHSVGGSTYYAIPAPKVDKYGRVVSINNMYLYPATLTRKGYIEASAYANLPVIRSTITQQIPAGEIETTGEFYLSLSGSTNVGILPVVNVYGEYTDSNGYKHMVNCDWDMYQTRDESTTERRYFMKAKIPEPLDYNLTVYVISNHTWSLTM